MSISHTLTHCPSVPVYNLANFSFLEITSKILKPGQMAEVHLQNTMAPDYLGGRLQANGGERIWVKIESISGELITGQTTGYKGSFWKNSLVRFRKEHICRMRSDWLWDHDHLFARVSPKVVYELEPVGYVSPYLAPEALSSGYAFYALSEKDLPKEAIELIRVPLAWLAAHDPAIKECFRYLEELSFFRKSRTRLWPILPDIADPARKPGDWDDDTMNF